MKLFFVLLTTSLLIYATQPESEKVKTPSLTLINPLGTGVVISTSFGLRSHPILNYERMHNGVDYRVNIGTPVFASADGKVVFSDVKGTSGKLIEVEHENGFKTRYAHLSGFGEGIKNGLLVEAGSIIGYSGETGLTNEPHLHFEVLLNGTAIDPAPYLE